MEELKKDIEKIFLYEKEKNEICKKIKEIEEKIEENYQAGVVVIPNVKKLF